MTLPDRLLRRPRRRAGLATISARVDDDSPTWTRTSASASNERDPAEIQEQHQDALTALRKNPFAKHIVDSTTDHCLRDGLTPTASGQAGASILFRGLRDLSCVLWSNDPSSTNKEPTS